MKKRNYQILSALLCLILLLLSGCGSGSKSAAPEMTIAETMAAAEEVCEEDSGFYGAEAMAMPSAVTEKGEGNASGTSAADSADSTQSNLPAGRKLIRNVSMYVETDDFDSLLSSIQEHVSGFGGYIERSDISGQRTNYQGSPLPRSAYLTIRIPSKQLDSFTASVENGANVINKSETTEDVTLRYSDIESRKKSLTIEQDRIWALLEKADTLDAVISLEERLSEIRYELEAMESQLRLYDNQVDYSTVDLSVDEVTVYTPTAPESVSERIQNGFSRSLEDVSDFLINLFVGIIAASPIWFPLLVLLLIGFSIAKGIRKKTKAKKADSSAPSDSAPKHT